MLYPAINIFLTTIIWQWSTTDLTSRASVSGWRPRRCQEKTATLSSFTMRQSERLEATSHKPRSQWHSLEGETNKQTKTKHNKNNSPKQTYEETPEPGLPCTVHSGLLETVRYLKAPSMRCNDFIPSPLDGYPPNSDFKKNCISPPIAEVSMNTASYKAFYKNNQSTSPIFF